jgi:class 3 adenylate cyclase
LFADIKGAMELMEDLDPEDARKIVDPALKLMIDAVRRCDGYVVQSTGTAFLPCSGRPSHTKTIRSARSMRRCGCKKQRAGIRHNWWPRAAPRWRHESASIPAGWWCEL